MQIYERYRLIFCNDNNKIFGKISSLVKVKRNVLLNTCVNGYSISILDIPLRTHVIYILIDDDDD